MAISFCAPGIGVGNSHITFRKLIVFWLLFVGQLSPIYADTSINSLSLETALKRALAQNPSLKIYDFRNSALTGQLETANLKPAYELAVEAENFLGSDEFSEFESAELTIALSSVLEMGDKRSARRGVVSSSRSRLDAQRQVESLELMGEVTRRYISVLAAQETVSLAEEAAGLAQKTLDLVKERFAAGATPQAEVKRAQAATALAQLALQSVQQQLNFSKVSLTALWGLTTPQFTAVDGDLFRFGTDIAFELLYTKVEQNPAIQIFASEERLRAAELRLSRTHSTANISWSVGLRRFQENDNSALVAGFSMPLFSSKRNAGAVSTALARRNEVYVQREVALLDMHTQLFRAFHNRQQAVVASKSLQNTIIPALEQALEEIQAAYQHGRYSYLEYVSARQELLDARRTLIESASSALIYAAEIEQLTAQPLAALQYGESTEFSGSNQ